MALLTIVTGGVAAGAASADITLQNPAAFDVYEGTPGPVLAHPRILTADQNRDGIADAVGGHGGSGLQLALGGTGGLGGGQELPGTTGTQAAALGDLDRDGRADLVRFQANRLTVSLGVSGGGFAEPVPQDLLLDEACADLALGDLDRDGDLDAIAACGNVLLRFVGNGSGTLSLIGGHALTDGIGAATHVEVVDWDRDGRLDVLVNDSSDGEVGFHHGNGDGTFAATLSLGDAGAFTDMAITDLDRDGILDLVGLPSGGSAWITRSWGRGNGYFSGGGTVAIPHGDATSIAVGDLDHDGRGDLVIGGPRGIMTASAQGDFIALPLKTKTAAWTTAMALGDVDGDRRTDVLLLGKDGSGPQVARNVTPERPTPNAYERIVPAPTTNSGPGYATSADLNRDGRPDLIVAQQTASRVGILLGNGDATFGARSDFWAGASSPAQIVPADMNRDGIPDLVVGHALGAKIGVVLGNGDGTFGTPLTQDLPLFSQSVGVAVGDFDRDGIPDVATANDDGQRASVFRGNGDGTLGTPTNYTTSGGRATAIASGDFDRDGKLDLAVVGGAFSARLNLLRGNGDGTFQAATVVNLKSGSQPLALRAVDLDRDGDLDLVTANYGDASVSVLTNVGGGFASRAEFPAWGSPRGLDVGDVDGDRIPDVVFSDGVGNTVGLLRGGGDGTLAAGRSLTVGNDPYGLAVADLDRDGRGEIAVPSYTQQTVAVLRGVTDAAAPTTTDNVTSSWSLTGRVTLTATDTGGAGVDKTYYTVGADPADPTTSSSVYSAPVTLADGERIKYFSVDTAGNAEAVRTSAAIKVDGTAPVSTASFSTDWQNLPVRVTLTATDAGSGVAEIRYTVGTNPGSPGPSSAVYDPANKPALAHNQKIRFRAIDVAGNAEAVKPASAAARVDTVVPTVSSDVTDAWSTAPVPVTLTPADTGGSGVAATHYEVGASPAAPTGSSPVYDPASKPTLRDGERIHFVTFDVAGNSSVTGSSVAVRVDEVAPETTDDVPSSWRTAPVPVTLDPTDARSGVAATYYEVGTSPAAPTTASPVYDPDDKPVLRHGERIAYRSADVAGNVEDVRTSDAAMVDTEAPDAPTLVTGPPAAAPATTASIAFAGEPDARFLCAVDGGPAAPCTSPLTLTDLAVGEHEVRIEQIDPAEHRSPALIVRFTVTAPPVDEPPVILPPVVQPPVVLPAPQPHTLRAVLGAADGAGRRPVVLVAGQLGIACATDRGAVAECRLEARSVRRLTTASGRRLPVGTVLAVGSSAPGVAASERLATGLRLTAAGRAARATHPLGLTARLVVSGTTASGTTVRGGSLIRLMTSDTLTIPVAGRSRALPADARRLLGRLVRTVGGQVKTVRCTADTDRSGDAAADRALTVAQAQAACRALTSRGLRARSTSEGRGSTRPRASNRTDRGRALNRRLTIRIGM